MYYHKQQLHAREIKDTWYLLTSKHHIERVYPIAEWQCQKGCLAKAVYWRTSSYVEENSKDKRCCRLNEPRGHTPQWWEIKVHVCVSVCLCVCVSNTKYIIRNIANQGYSAQLIISKQCVCRTANEAPRGVKEKLVQQKMPMYPGYSTEQGMPLHASRCDHILCRLVGS